MIDKLIESEMRYFAPILEDAEQTANEDYAGYRSETVAERRARISHETHALCGGKVTYGAFKGLRLNRHTWWGGADLGAQCLGIYEKHILDFISSAGPFSTFLDIGAADGFYAVGMLYSRYAAKTICFETSKKGRDAIKKNWIANNSVGELEIHGEADGLSIEKVANQLTFPAFVLLDIEGGEFELLSPRVISLLRHCDVIIEVHSWVTDFPAKYQRLLTDLYVHFEVEVLAHAVRDVDSIPLLATYPDDNRLLVASEGRPYLMRFLRLVPRISLKSR